MGMVDIFSLVTSFIYWFISTVLLLAIILTAIGAWQYHRNKRANRELLRQRSTIQPSSSTNTINPAANNTNTTSSSNPNSSSTTDRHHHDRSERAAAGTSRRSHSHHSNTSMTEDHDDTLNDEDEDWARNIPTRKRGGSQETTSNGTHISPLQQTLAHSRGRSIYDAVKKASKRGTAALNQIATQSSHSNKRSSTTDAPPSESNSIPPSPAASPRPSELDEVPALPTRESSLDSHTSSQDTGSPSMTRLEADDQDMILSHSPVMEEGEEQADNTAAAEDSPSESVSNSSSERLTQAHDGVLLKRRARIRSKVLAAATSATNADHSHFSWSLNNPPGSTGSTSSSINPTPIDDQSSSVPPSPPQPQLSSAAKTLLTMFPQLSPLQFMTATASQENHSIPTPGALIYSQLLALITQSHTQRLLTFVADTLKGMVESELKHEKLSTIQRDILWNLIDKYKKEEINEKKEQNGPDTDTNPSTASVTPLATQLLSLVVDATNLAQSSQSSSTSSTDATDPPIITRKSSVSSRIPATHANGVSTSVSQPILNATTNSSTTTDSSNSSTDVVRPPPSSSVAPTFNLAPSSNVSTTPVIPRTPLVLPPLPPSTLSTPQLISITQTYLLESHGQRAQLAQQLCMQMNQEPITPSTNVNSSSTGSFPSDSHPSISPALVYSEMYSLLQSMNQTLTNRLQARINTTVQTTETNGNNIDLDATAPESLTEVKDRPTLSSATFRPTVESTPTPLLRIRTAGATLSSSRQQAHQPNNTNGAEFKISTTSDASGDTIDHRVQVAATTGSSTSSSIASTPTPNSTPPNTAANSRRDGRPSLSRPASYPAPRSIDSIRITDHSTTQNGSDPTSPTSHTKEGSSSSGASNGHGHTNGHISNLRTPSQPHGNSSMHTSSMLFTPSPGSIASVQQQHQQQLLLNGHTSVGHHQPHHSPNSNGMAGPPRQSPNRSSYPGPAGPRHSPNQTSSNSSSNALFNSSMSLAPPFSNTNKVYAHTTSNTPTNPLSPTRFIPPPLLQSQSSLSHSSVSPTISQSSTTGSGPLSPFPMTARPTHQRQQSPSYSTATFPPKRQGKGSSDQTSIMSMIKNLGREMKEES